MATPLSLKLDWEKANNLWAGILNPVILNPLNNVQILTDIVLVNGVTTFNHKLGRMQQGWFILDINASASIYRSQPFNASTLTLTSNASVTISIGVF